VSADNDAWRARNDLLSLRAMSSYLPDAIPLADVRRALVTKLRHHGDVLLASPVFTTLARAAPHVEIDALVYRETAPMLAHHPAIAQIHTVDRDAKRAGVLAQLRAERSLLAALRARRYDLLIHLTEHPRGLTLAHLLRPRYAVTRQPSERAGLWQRRFTHFYRLPRQTPRHAVEANLDALRRIGVQPQEKDKRLVLVPGRDAEVRADDLLREFGVAPFTFVHAHPGSRWLFKCWTAQANAAFLDRVASDGHAIVVTGAPDPRERSLVAATLDAVAPQTRAQLVDLTGQLTLPEVAAITARARVFFGVDSAPMHIAAAMGTPTLALFGPSGEHEWGPWKVAQRVVTSQAHPCRPCGIDGCGGGKVSECLTSLAVAGVYDAFMSLLGETRARASR
jgi:lipopolysaccharide heptosyltransferase III